MTHKNSCPIYIASKGQWAASIEPECNCFIKNNVDYGAFAGKISPVKSNFMKKTVSVPVAWFERLLVLRKSLGCVDVKYNAENIETMTNLNFLLGYIESAESFIKE